MNSLIDRFNRFEELHPWIYARIGGVGIGVVLILEAVWERF